MDIGRTSAYPTRAKEDLAKHRLSRKAALDRREAASSGAPAFQTNTNAGGRDLLVVVVPQELRRASRRPAHPSDERRSAKPS